MPAMPIWVESPTASSRTLVALRRELHLTTPPARCRIRVFAATRFRLWCNGVELLDGPLRFQPQVTEWQELDLAPHLRPGANQVMVLVEERRVSSYQAVDQPAGLWLESPDDPRWNSDASWSARQLTAWRTASAPFSFAIGPVEVCDTRMLPAGWPQPHETWPAAVARRVDWALPSAPSLPPALSTRQPLALVMSAALASQPAPCGYWAHHPICSGGGRRQRRPSYGWVHSSGGICRFRSMWGPHALNGEVLPEGSRHPTLGNCLEQTITLRPGWNLLYSEVEWLAKDWGLRLELAPGLELRQAPDPTAPLGLCVGPVLEESELTQRRGGRWPTDAAALAALGLTWTSSADLPLADCPARLCAWDEAAEPLTATGPWTLPASGALSVIGDAGMTCVGTLELQLCTDCELTIDAAIDEHRRSDGLLALYASNHLINAVDRYVIAAGTSLLRGLPLRGGRFVQVTLRGTPGARVELRSAALVGQTWRLADRAALDAPPLADLLNLGFSTVQQCLADGWIDPWREQGFYLGDTWQAYRATRGTDHALAQALGIRAVRLFAAAQLPGGGFPCVAPAWFTAEHPDFSLLWSLLLHELWADSGDLGVVADCWPQLERLWQADEAACAGDALRRGVARIFLDWGIRLEERSPHCNTAYNAIRVRALRASSTLARMLGNHAAAAAWSTRADHAAAALRQACRPAGVGWVAGLDAAGRALPGSCLAARIHLAQADLLAEEELDALATDLLAQGRSLDSTDQHDGHADLYLLADALDALARHGRTTEALGIAVAHWGFMRARGATTAWEALHRGRLGRDSLCHVWSCGQVPFLLEWILGVQREVGRPCQIVLRPHLPTGLDHLAGSIDTPRGRLEIAWTRDCAGRVLGRCTTPHGVVVAAGPGVSLSI